MELWIIATLAAASFQTVRFMLQKALSASQLSAAGATFARFLYSAPIVVLLLAGYLTATGTSLPDVPRLFWSYGALGGLAQILATVCVVMLFKERNFAVGITFKKTEVIQTVLVGLILLGEGVAPLAFLFIFIGLIGVLLLSKAPGSTTLKDSLLSKATGLGLASGVFFAMSGVAYRGASLQLDLDQPLLRAGITLATVTSMQLIAMTVWLRLREPGELTRVWRARGRASLIGLTSMLGSFSWFTAFTLQNAAYVNAVGQIELILSLAASTLFFKEKVIAREYVGIGVLTISILGLILAS